ncbi:MAG TPA: hypothetical protein VII72_22890 [Myxococcota bacterium]
MTTYPRPRRQLSRSAALWLVCLASLAPAAGVRAASEEELLEIIHRLEQRVEQLETREEDERVQAESDPVAREAEPENYDTGGSWADRVRLSGSANTGWYGGAAHAVIPQDSFQVWDARFFVDAELARDVSLGETTLVRDIGFLFEWDLVRLGDDDNRVGELYTDFQGLGGQEWANVQVGRFQIPVGENYLRFSQGYHENPFIYNTLGGPWFWDEGLRIYGREGKFGWVASVSDGQTQFNFDPNTDKQFTLKLFADPLPWLHVSASGLRSGPMGSSSSAAMGALWLGESWARAFGASTGIPNYVDGVVVPDGPNRLKDSWLAGGDVILHFPDLARIWLGGGWYGINSTGADIYDRDLFYWIAEVVLEGAAAAPVLAPFYLGLRADGLGTYDSDEGYLLDSRQNATLGFNAKSYEAYSMVLGWRMTDGVTLRAEYSIRDVGLVNGVNDGIRGDAGGQDLYGIEIGVDF